jgi:hypothetical protein
MTTKLFLAAPLAFMFAAAPASAEVVKNPEAGTFQAAIVDSLKLLKDNKFDDWIRKYCSKEKLCFNQNSERDLKRYNLPAKSRRAAACLREDGAGIDIQRVEDISETEKKVFLNCEKTAMPVPFYVVNEGGKWLFSSI